MKGQPGDGIKKLKREYDSMAVALGDARRAACELRAKNETLMKENAQLIERVATNARIGNDNADWAATIAAVLAHTLAARCAQRQRQDAVRRASNDLALAK